MRSKSDISLNISQFNFPHVVSQSVLNKTRKLRSERFAEKEDFKTGMKERMGDG